MTDTRNIATVLQTNIDHGLAIDLALEQNERRQNIKPFLNYVYAQITHPEQTYFQIGLGVTGVIIGVLSTYSAYPLAADALQVFADSIDAGVVTTKLLEVFFGVLSFILTAALVGLPCLAEFKKFANFLLRKPILPPANDRQALRWTFRIIAEVLGMFTGIPFFMLLIPYFDHVPFLNYFVPTTALISSYCLCLSVEKELIDYYFTRTAPANSLRQDLLTHLAKASRLINAKNDADFENFYQTLRVHHAADPITLRALNILITIFKESFIEDEASDRITVDNTPINKIILDAVVLIIGLVSTFVYYDYAYDFGSAFYTLFGMADGDTKEGLSVTMAVLSVFTNAIFDAMYAKYDSDYIYAAIRSGQRWPSRQAIFAHTCAALASLPSIFLAFDETQSTLARTYTLPVFIGSTLARALTFNMMIDICNDIYQGKNSLRGRKKDFNNISNLLQQAITKLPESYLPALTREMNIPQPNLNSVVLVSNHANAIFSPPKAVPIMLELPQVNGLRPASGL